MTLTATGAGSTIEDVLRTCSLVHLFNPCPKLPCAAARTDSFKAGSSRLYFGRNNEKF
jgi:hypothetical protein